MPDSPQSADSPESADSADGQESADTAPSDLPRYRYDAARATEIETRHQAAWDAAGVYEAPNPSGQLAADPFGVAGAPKLFIMDMFPYPSGSGLHVGHPLGYIATDVYARFKRMTGHNVLHTIGFDAFGLPAEEHARQTGEHPRTNTEHNIAVMKRQMARLGLGHDRRRAVATTDEPYYRWTQWIFLQIFESWFDPAQNKARPIAELIAELDSGARSLEDGRDWAALSPVERRRALGDYRLAYLAEAPVNWCPALGTVLANEEVTSEGRSERGNHPVFQRPLEQWMMRITAYADRLLEDLDLLDWSESIKTMQRNWIGRSEGAHIDFGPIRVFTTRPDTIFGATYMVLAPEHPLVDTLAADAWPAGTDPRWTAGATTPAEAIAGYRAEAADRAASAGAADTAATAEAGAAETADDHAGAADTAGDDEDRGAGDKTGVFTGAYVDNPVNGEPIPVFVADYVLMGYGTGAIMAVPGEDERDWEFAEEYGLPIVRTVEPPEGFDGKAYDGDGPSINSGFLDGLGVSEAKAAIIDWLEEHGCGERTVTYKMRDWLFSRQRYWGEPFPIVYDDSGIPMAVPETELPVTLPDLLDWAPRVLDDASVPEPPLGRADDWRHTELDLGDGPKAYRRELNTMPQWAGSCWYYLRYLDPANDDAMVDPAVERYWMSDPGSGPATGDGHGEGAGDGKPEAAEATGHGVGGVDLYVGGVEHAVLHLLYSRFWHKVLFDLGHVSGPEPFKRLVNQGYIQAWAYTDARGAYVPAEEVQGDPETGFSHHGEPVERSFGKMGKGLKNSVTPDEMYAAYGADTLRLYEMSMGPIDQDRPWETRSVVGSMRLLQRVWRNLVDEHTGEPAVAEPDAEPDDELRRALHRTIDGVRADMDGLRFNTAIAKITELNNLLTARPGPTPRPVAEALVLMLSPLVPHFAEELWALLGGSGTVTRVAFPEADPALLVADTIEMPVQVNGKLRAVVTVAADASDDDVLAAATAEPNVIAHVDGRELRKSIVIPGRMVTLVV